MNRRHANIRTHLLVSVWTLVAVAFASAAQAPSIVGAYRDCPYPCVSVRINADRTFDIVFSGDLYNGEGSRGTWTFEGDDQIRVVIPKNTSQPRVIETTTGTNQNVHIAVTDNEGAVVAGATVSGVAADTPFLSTTNVQGECFIPHCSQFTIAIMGYEGTYRVKRPRSNDFLVKLSYEQIGWYALDEIWLVDGEHIEMPGTDNGVGGGMILTRLSPEKEKEVFP